jgi:hypothetical protein
MMEFATQETADELLEAMEEFNVACARITPKQARLLKLLSSGEPRQAAVQAAGYDARNPAGVLNTFRKRPRFAAALQAAYKLHALNFGLPAAWKREQLVYIVGRHRDQYPAAAISALRLLAELDGDLKSPLVQINNDDRILVVTPESLRQMAGEAMKTIEHKE